MIKWPEKVWLGDMYGYTEAQLKQAVREAYEDAASVVDNADSPDCGGWDMTHIAERIRALIKEIP